MSRLASAIHQPAKTCAASMSQLDEDDRGDGVRARAKGREREQERRRLAPVGGRGGVDEPAADERRQDLGHERDGRRAPP